MKVLLDSEDEVNSPGIAAVVAANGALLSADAVVLLDGPVHARGRPTIVFGNRGNVRHAHRLRTARAAPQRALRNWVPNPAERLARLLATMKDEDGRVDGGRRTTGARTSPSRDREGTQKCQTTRPALRKRVGIVQPEKVGATYQEALQYPLLNVQGLAAASVGEKSANIVPRDAVAEIDLRTTVESIGVLHTSRRSTSRRRAAPRREGADGRGARAAAEALGVRPAPSGREAARQPVDRPVGRWVSSALARGLAGARRPHPHDGWHAPESDEIVGPLKALFVLVPLVNPSNEHAYDENLCMGNYLSGMRTLAALLLTDFGE